VHEPEKELERLHSPIEEICSKLVDLSLDIQTGKDRNAAETIQYFTGIAEKIFRIFKQLVIQGFITDTTVIELLNNFAETVKELLEAYERQDSVLIGDLAEYEIAPRLKVLYTTITEKIQKSEKAEN